MKYKKVSNNENVIEIGGKVVLSFDPRYKEYLKWRDENPDLELKLINELELEIENRKLYNLGAPHENGDIREWYHKNGQLNLICEMKNNKKDGVERGFYDTGELRSVVHYKNGKKHGKLKFYHQYKGLFVKKNKVQTWKDGKLHGEYIDYHLNNNERARGNMLYGMMEGNWTFWYHNGKKELECEFDFGNPVGSAKIYHDNGVLKKEVSF
jgi:antitoxin component YwqK of YwqJK toxin-antitoxin module|tara:strand:+ start:737 stop:1366 length:630 start_codon:yes stop_codon:yes gene_type:complete